MKVNNGIQYLGILASVALPFFNIPLILRMVRRRSSEDLSLVWVLGVFVCIVLMEPVALVSSDFVFKIFSIVNLLFFSVVTFFVLYYRWVKKKEAA